MLCPWQLFSEENYLASGERAKVTDALTLQTLPFKVPPDAHALCVYL